MFGTRMVTHGTAYPILRKLGGIQAGDPQISLPDKMELIRQKVTQGLNRTHERAEKAYNTCSYPKVLNMTTPNKSSSSQVGNSTRRSVAPTAYENG